MCLLLALMLAAHAQTAVNTSFGAYLLDECGNIIFAAAG